MTGGWPGWAVSNCIRRRRCSDRWPSLCPARVSAAASSRALLDRARAHGAGCVVLLTTTAAAFFTRFGFTVVTRDDVPAAVQTSAEFQGACPAGATVMLATLPYAGRGPGRPVQKL